MILCLSILNRYHISIHMPAINLQVSYTLFRIIRILNVEVIGGTAEAAGEGEVTEALRNTRIDGKSVIGWLHTQDCLGEVDGKHVNGNMVPVENGKTEYHVTVHM